MPEANSNGMILAKEEENDAEVRREDQDRINEFGQLNARLHEVRGETSKLKVSFGLSVLLATIIFDFACRLPISMLVDHNAFQCSMRKMLLLTESSRKNR